MHDGGALKGDTAMDEPVTFDAGALRAEKTKVLNAIVLPKDLQDYAVRGQYDQGWLAGERVKSYLAEDNIARVAEDMERADAVFDPPAECRSRQQHENRGSEHLFL